MQNPDRVNRCRNNTCSSGLGIDQELVCSSCWDIICQDQRYAELYQRYLANVAALNNEQTLTQEERVEAIEYQRYEVEAIFLGMIDAQILGAVGERHPRIRDQQTAGEGSAER